MMMQFVSSVETKTALDNPSRKGSDGGNWLQMVHEREAERLGSEEGEGRGSVAIGGAPTAHKRKRSLSSSRWQNPSWEPAGRESWEWSPQVPAATTPSLGAAGVSTISATVALDLRA